MSEKVKKQSEGEVKGNISLRFIRDLANNKLSSIPPHVGNLTKLNGLYLAANNLTKLPQELGHLSDSLYYLYVPV